eukprot:TRINITY_DN20799_c0_g1_i7.p1 TRINITY_DN20799_c0_g1~~TRINITY_DN20799_c0_g1_i7.p1  ORF type:complete len:256 (+),score=40.87 TRINITY_DN20799_c0_g1_i7:37-804(+)
MVLVVLECPHILTNPKLIKRRSTPIQCRRPHHLCSHVGISFYINTDIWSFVIRLGISYPELTEMQARAIFEAAIFMSNHGIKILPEIMVPLVGTPQELGHQVNVIRSIAEKVFSEMGASISYKVGTMIEIPRAALVADEIAEEAEFFSFGTNDLTQMTFGYSRDDVGKFLPIYLSKGVLQNDPFEVLDQKGVGQLIKIATERGRAARPNLKVGICGEHGGEPSSVAFFAEAGLDYVSCSPFRVPIARLAAAQVAV